MPVAVTVPVRAMAAWPVTLALAVPVAVAVPLLAIAATPLGVASALVLAAAVAVPRAPMARTPVTVP